MQMLYFHLWCLQIIKLNTPDERDKLEMDDSTSRVNLENELGELNKSQ